MSGVFGAVYLALGCVVAGAVLHRDTDAGPFTLTVGIVVALVWPVLLLASLGAAIGRRLEG